MHCSSCGTAVIQGLNYCKNCGAKVGARQELSEASFNTLVGSIVGIAIAGLALILGMMVVMKKELGFTNEAVFLIALMSFVIILAAESVFIWLLIRNARKEKETPASSVAQFETAKLKQVEIKGLNEASAQGFVEPIPTVTEQTTRNLETILREPNMK